MKPLFILFFLFSISSLFSQQISGTITDSNGNAIEFVSVTLFQSADSLLVKGEVTDEQGKFYISETQPGKYYIECSFVGFESFRSAVFTLEDKKSMDFGNIALQASTQIIEEVTIKARKPLIEIHADKMILNTDASISAVGSNGLDLLRKAPGVTIDNNENIQLKGKNGVNIYIDGKPSYLSPAELASLLKGLTSADIEAI